jgi:prepilin-type processing-associated H-X9-DG protein
MKRRGFTLLQGFILFASTLILAAILFPMFARPRGGCVLRPSCQSNLKQIALAFKQYIQDYNEKYPIAKNSTSGLDKTDNWAGQLSPYLKSAVIFQCPSDVYATDSQKSSYGYNARLSSKSEEKLSDIAAIVLNFEVVADPNNWTQTGTVPQNVTASTRHLDGSNFSFMDGHVKWYAPGKVGMLKDGSPTFVPF